MKKYIYSGSAVLLFILLLSPFLLGTSGESDYSSYVAERKNMDLRLYVRGELKAAKFFQIKSDIMSNRAKIIELIPEGSRVAKGVLVARFDSKPFTDEFSSWEQKIRDTENKIINIEKEIEGFKAKEEEERKTAQYSIDLEKIKLEDQRKGSGYLKLKELETDISQNTRSLEIAKGEVEDYKSLFQSGYISKRELEKNEDEVLKLEEGLRIAKEKLDIYKNFEWPEKIRQSELALQKSKEVMENQLKQIEIKINNMAEQLKNEKDNLLHFENKLEQSKEDIVNCEIYAPIEGVVLYNEIPFNGKKRKIEIGDSVWYGQSFMQIPDTSNMIVSANVREFDLKHISKGQKTTIIPDAFSDRKFNGEIDYIANVANTNNSDDPVKFFEIIINVNHSSEEILRSGMSANIEIAYSNVNNAIVVPVEAVINKNDKKYVRLAKGSSYLLKEIEVGAIGLNYAQITSGVNEGDQVYFQ